MTTNKFIMILTLAAWSVAGQAQSHQQTINKTLQFEKPAATNVLYVANINGNVRAEGYNGSTIQIEVVKKITAKTESRLEAAKALLDLGVIDRSDTIFVYVKGVCGTFSNKNSGRWKNNSSWGYNWNDCEQSFDYKMDFVIKVPYSSNIYLSTINEGDISAENIQGIVNAKNINGGISLNKISNINYAHTINGDVTMNIDKHPTQKGSYYSLNGDIVANYRRGLSAELSFKSYNGDFFTNIPQVEQMPQTVEISKTNGSEGIQYKLEGRTIVKAGKGGVRLDFETFNGDVYIKEIIN
jgi:hypothetical protein